MGIGCERNGLKIAGGAGSSERAWSWEHEQQRGCGTPPLSEAGVTFVHMIDRYRWASLNIHLHDLRS